MNEKTNESAKKKGSNTEGFLLSEFDALQERAIGLEGIKSSRVNFFLIVAAATIAGVSGLADVKSIEPMFPYVVILGAFFLFLLGISTLKNVTDYSIAIVSLFRRAGRIRRWFVDNNSEIERYVAFQANDDRPKIYIGKSLLTWRGGEPILVISNTATASIIIGVSLSFVALIWALVGALFSALIVWQLQIWYLSRKLAKHQLKEESNVNFPSNENAS